MKRTSFIAIAAGVAALCGSPLSFAQWTGQSEAPITTPAQTPSPTGTQPSTSSQSQVGAEPSTSTPMQGQPGWQQPAPQQPSDQPAAQQPTPAPVVVETTVDMRSGAPQSPESQADARKEAVSALAEAKVACKREASKQARNDCLRQAQDDYNALMGRSERR